MQRSAKILIVSLFALYLAMVMFFCFYKFNSPGLDLGKHFLGIRLDRYAHFTMFFPYPFIAWLTCRFAARHEFFKRNAIIITFITGLAFAALTEVFQDWFFSARQGDVLDFAADSISIATGTIIVSFLGHPIVRLADRLFGRNEKK